MRYQELDKKGYQQDKEKWLFKPKWDMVWFDTSRCADEAQSKPHPDMLKQIITELGVNAEQAIMVGDTSHDLKMAQAINMPRVGVSHGAHPVSVLAQYQPLAIIDRLPELTSLVVQ